MISGLVGLCTLRPLINSFVRSPTNSLPLSDCNVMGQPSLSMYNYQVIARFLRWRCYAGCCLFKFGEMINHYRHLIVSRGCHAYLLMINLYHLVEPWWLPWLQEEPQFSGVLCMLTRQACWDPLFTGLLETRLFESFLYPVGHFVYALMAHLIMWKKEQSVWYNCGNTIELYL